MPTNTELSAQQQEIMQQQCTCKVIVHYSHSFDSYWSDVIKCERCKSLYVLHGKLALAKACTAVLDNRDKA